MFSFLFGFLRNVALAGIFLVTVFVFAVAMKTGEMPSFSSSRDALVETVPALEAVPFLDNACRFPKAYRVGAIDSNFHLSREEFAEAVRLAAELWKTGVGVEVFAEIDRPSALPVNLVFDNRQAETDALKETSSDIEAGRAAYDKLRAEYLAAKRLYDTKKANADRLASLYESALAAYRKRVERYNDRFKKYAEQVSYWNGEGGAPQDEYEELDDERAALEKEAKSLEKTQGDLEDRQKKLKQAIEESNAIAGKTNTLAGNLNRLARSLNISVDSYNRVAGAREEFTTGLYTEDESGKRIDVFQFYDRDDLVRILAHELGHALGLGHAANPSSLMYPSIEQQPLALTDEDRTLFFARCPKKE